MKRQREKPFTLARVGQRGARHEGGAALSGRQGEARRAGGEDAPASVAGLRALVKRRERADEP